MGEIFGTRENFERYQITRLLEQQLMVLRSDKRLILAGCGNFRQHHRQVHDLMTRLTSPTSIATAPKARTIGTVAGWSQPWDCCSIAPAHTLEATLPQRERTR